MNRKIILALMWVFVAGIMYAQNTGISKFNLKDGLKFNLSDDGNTYIKMTFTAQNWTRYNWNNPGSTIYNEKQAETFDVGLRRTRMQIIGQLTTRTLLYVQMGTNNLNYLTARKTGIFFHDVVTEYAFIPKHLYIGSGLCAWGGSGRYSSPSVASILTLDAPLYQQSTNDATDQFLRKLTVYAKGKISKLDYRLAIAKPMAFQQSPLYTAAPPSTTTNFSSAPPHLQYQGYFNWQFFGQEANTLPYAVGTYLGKKKVFNAGAGFVSQKKAMWYKSSATATDTSYSSMVLFTADVFYDAPVDKEKKTALTVYAAYSNFNMGKNYLRNLGPMAPTTGLAIGTNNFNGTGSAYPTVGTGSTIYMQAGYMLRDSLLGTHGTLQPYIDCQYSIFQRIKSPVIVPNLGVNWLISGHNSKVSLNFQSHPVFITDGNGDIIESKSSRRGGVIIQFQIMF